MGSYVQNSLIAGERIEHAAVISWMSQIWYFIFSVVLITTIIIPILFIVFAILNVLTTELAVSNKKIIGKVGFIRRTSVDLPLSKLESININQGVFGRIFNYGTVGFRGVGGNDIAIPYIKDPLSFRRIVMNLIESKSPAHLQPQI